MGTVEGDRQHLVLPGDHGPGRRPAPAAPGPGARPASGRTPARPGGARRPSIRPPGLRRPTGLRRSGAGRPGWWRPGGCRPPWPAPPRGSRRPAPTTTSAQSGRRPAGSPTTATTTAARVCSRSIDRSASRSGRSSPSTTRAAAPGVDHPLVEPTGLQQGGELRAGEPHGVHPDDGNEPMVGVSDPQAYWWPATKGKHGG